MHQWDSAGDGISILKRQYCPEGVVVIVYPEDDMWKIKIDDGICTFIHEDSWRKKENAKINAWRFLNQYRNG